MQADLAKASEVLQAPCRESVLYTLADGNANKSALKENVDYHGVTIGRALSELRQMGLVEELTGAGDGKGAIYGTTEEGDELATWLREECL